MGTTGPNRRKQAGQPGGPDVRVAGQPGPLVIKDGPEAVGGAGRLLHRTDAKRAVEGERQAMKRVFDIPSDFAASRDVQLRIMEDVLQAGFDEESVFAIRISLEEAIVNAIRHGNAMDPAKRVYVESVTTPHHVEIIVEDQGRGFDRGVIPDPTADENLCRPNGRGILLIESYMTDVRWEKGGSRVHMIKHAVPAEGAVDTKSEM